MLQSDVPVCLLPAVVTISAPSPAPRPRCSGSRIPAGCDSLIVPGHNNERNEHHEQYSAPASPTSPTSSSSRPNRQSSARSTSSASSPRPVREPGSCSTTKFKNLARSMTLPSQHTRPPVINVDYSTARVELETADRTMPAPSVGWTYIAKSPIPVSVPPDQPLPARTVDPQPILLLPPSRLSVQYKRGR